MKRTYNTLFMLMSVDGKISVGDSDLLDVDKNFKEITGLKEGLQQYYDLEQETDLFSLNTGRVFAKIGFNEKTEIPSRTPVTLVVVDNQPHLNEQGITYISHKAEQLILVTTNKEHPAYSLQDKFSNIKILFYEKEINFEDLFTKLKTDFGAERVTIQSGGTLNEVFLRKSLIDRVLVVVAPALIGGKNTSTLVDGQSIHNESELSKLRTLKLVKAQSLNNSYLLLEYTVNN
jgi:2,5-diamino-6-(ribosylamino)-4(3H)-pyrimidinone 5'-phosphate reductase